MPDIKMVSPQTESCRDGDAGSCAIGFYFVSDGVLKMCGESGRPTGKTHRLQAGDDERVIASRLTLEAWRRSGAASDFNRPLHYGRHGIA